MRDRWCWRDSSSARSFWSCAHSRSYSSWDLSRSRSSLRADTLSFGVGLAPLSGKVLSVLLSISFVLGLLSPSDSRRAIALELGERFACKDCLWDKVGCSGSLRG